MFAVSNTNRNDPISDVTLSQLAFRSLLVVLRIAAAYVLSKQVSPFFYQQF